jgi:hypothetical protein
MIKWIRDNRHKLLPEIKDWTIDHNEIRLSNNVKALSYAQWFWLHPSCYNLLSYGISVIALITFTPATIYFLFFNDYKILALLPAILLVSNIFYLIGKIKNHHLQKNVTFYDLMMRDYGGDKIANTEETNNADN